MKISEMWSRAIGVIRQDKMTYFPFVFFFVVMGLIESLGFGFSTAITSLKFSRGQIMYFVGTTLCSELLIKNLTIAWTGQVLASGRVMVGVGSLAHMIKRLFHLSLALLTLIIPAMILGGGFALMGGTVGSPLVAGIVLISMWLWLFTQFSSHFIIFESDPFWRGLYKSIVFVRHNFKIAISVFAVGFLSMMMAGMIGVVGGQIPVIGVGMKPIIEGIGATMMIVVQTVVFVTLRAKYQSVA